MKCRLFALIKFSSHLPRDKHPKVFLTSLLELYDQENPMLYLEETIQV